MAKYLMVVEDGQIKSKPLATGDSTGTGSQQTIAHTLGAIPNYVSIVLKADETDELTFYADATNLYITCTSGKTYNWSAAIL